MNEVTVKRRSNFNAKGITFTLWRLISGLKLGILGEQVFLVPFNCENMPNVGFFLELLKTIKTGHQGWVAKNVLL